MVQTADGSPEEGAGRKDDDMSNPMWVHIIRLLDDEEQANEEGAPDLLARSTSSLIPGSGRGS